MATQINHQLFYFPLGQLRPYGSVWTVLRQFLGTKRSSLIQERTLSFLASSNFSHLWQNIFVKTLMVRRPGKTPMSMRSWKAMQQINSVVNLWRKI